jgi:hypothetical protein
MDPLSLIAMASTTFKGIETLINGGAEIEHVALKLGQWYGFASDIKEAEKQAENPGVFRTLFEGDTVEQQALSSVIAKKKLQEQEKQIRELIVWAYGPETYQEMIMLRREIKARREKVIYKQKRKQQLFIDSLVVVIGVLFVGFILFATASVIQGSS